ncbi:ATP-binding protein [Thiomicrospira sp. XS5]|nr:ATP-binding protein [Thiomicrospira sp. XS5]
MSDEQRDAIEKAIDALTLDEIKPGALNAKSLQAVQLKKTHLTLELALPFPAKSLWPAIEQQLQHALLQLDGIETVDITFSTDIKAHAVQGRTEPLKNVKNIIAVASGKGGVGKSTTSVNLALALQQEGAQVALLDADIYGPSIPTMLGVHDKPETKDGKSMEPLSAYGLQLMSIGFLINPDDPMIWRGPIVTSTLTQLLNETNWQSVDYLIIDLPPGTGDVQLTLSQQIPVTGSVIVTTPQEVALIDARKGLRMFEKVNIPVLGVVENMSTHVCSQCGHEEAIFGENGGQKLAEQFKVPFLGALPLDSQIRAQSDQGTPTVTAMPTSAAAQKYRGIAHQVSAQIATKRRDYASAFPNIVVENS